MSEVTSDRIEANGVALALHDLGGRGAPVLLAHATGFHGRVWAEIAEGLVARGRHVWSWDFRGHGDSGESPTGYSWDGFAADALAVVDHLGLAGDPALVACGHSKGGAALLLGEEARPGTYARIWAYEPILFQSMEPLPPDADFVLARTARKRRNEWSSLDEAYSAFASKPPLNAMTERSLRAYVDYGLRDRGDGMFELKCRPDVEAEVYTMAPANGAFARLGEIGVPVHVVSGEYSHSIDADLALAIAERIPRGSVEVMPGLGHFGPQEDPAACVASILDFVKPT